MRCERAEDPRLILVEAIVELDGLGYRVGGTVAHGAAECYDDQGQVQVVNDELFSECARPEQGSPVRTVGA